MYSVGRQISGRHYKYLEIVFKYVLKKVFVYVIGRMAVVFGINSASIVNRKE